MLLKKLAKYFTELFKQILTNEKKKKMFIEK